MTGSRVAIAALALAVLLAGILTGTFAASDTDPYGYVGQADAIAHGTPRIDVQFARAYPWPDPESSFVPPGYTLSPDKRYAVPVYPSGLPLVMALAQTITGTRIAMFVVVPLLGAIAVWVTGTLGARVHSPLAGVVAAALLASSPVFLMQVVQPVSDVPATAWWTLCLALVMGGGAARALGGGIAASMAILTRSHLVVAMPVIAAYLFWPALGGDPGARRDARVRTAAFLAGVIPGCLAVAALNTYFQGSPLRSGYAPLTELFRWEHVPPNLARYPAWLVETQSPLILLGLLAPFVVSRLDRRERGRLTMADAWMLLAFIAVVFISCVFFGVFDREQWGFVRYLLPAYPPLILLTAVVLLEGIRRVLPDPRRAAAIALVVTAVWAGWQTYFAKSRGAFVLRYSEQRYADVGTFIASATAPNAVLVASLHSGSIRYYSGRLTLNYARLDPASLNTAIDTLRREGRDVLIVLEEGEEPHFREWFAPSGGHAALDWPPRHQTFEGIRINVRHPDDRAGYFAGAPIVTTDIRIKGEPVVHRR
jgi:hypothetical protein